MNLNNFFSLTRLSAWCEAALYGVFENDDKTGTHTNRDIGSSEIKQPSVRWDLLKVRNPACYVTIGWKRRIMLIYLILCCDFLLFGMVMKLGDLILFQLRHWAHRNWCDNHLRDLWKCTRIYRSKKGCYQDSSFFHSNHKNPVCTVTLFSTTSYVNKTDKSTDNVKVISLPNYVISVW